MHRSSHDPWRLPRMTPRACDHMHASLPSPPNRACRRLTDACRHLAPRLRARSLPTTAEPAGRHLCRGARPTPRPNQSARTHSTDLRPAPLSTTLQHPSLTVRPDTPLRRRGATPPTGRYAAYWPLRRLLAVTPPTGRYAAYWPLRRLLAVAPPTGRYAAYWPLHRLLAVTPPTGRYTAYWPLQRLMAVTPHDRYASH